MLMFPIFTDAIINLSFHFLQLIMKKLFFITLVASASMFFSNKLNAQVGLGGFPKSMTVGNSVQTTSAKITLERPDYEKLSREDATKGEGNGTMYRTGITLPAHIDFHKSGSWTYLSNGEKIWKLSVAVPEAQGIVLMYEKFHLPKGVSLYLSNENKKQILGAYTQQHNPKTDYYSNEPVLGSVVDIEMNFAADADVSKVQYVIKYAGAFYRGLESEQEQYDTWANPPVNPGGVLGMSASCHVEAICPEADIVGDQRKSVARILISPNAEYQSLGFCTGTLINSTGNTAENCRRLFVTASHCDSNNGRTNEHFQYWQFRFNYMRSNCAGTGNPTSTVSPILTEGGKFVSRSNYPSMTSNENALVQDFLLLELNDDFSKIPGAVMAGWNRKATYSNEEFDEVYTQFTSLHHPGGDVMKLNLSGLIQGDGTFNQNAISNTHWSMSSQIGGSAGGSSGSSLFDIYGRSIGVLSGGPDGNCSDGRKFGVVKEYSKFSYGWENQFDQTAFPAFAGAQSRLKDALDPVNSGIEGLQSTTVAECNGNSIVKVNSLDKNAFVVYPNPTTSGSFNVLFNMPAAKEVTINVVNVLGQSVKTVKLTNVTQQSFVVDCSGQSAGLYMVNVLADGKQLTKAITISK